MRIHYHSDCGFFAGCEKMLVNFWTNTELRNNHQISFSYRQTAGYMEGLCRHITPDFPVFPLALPVENWPRNYPSWGASLLRRRIATLIQVVTAPFFFVFDMIVLIRLFRSLAPDIVHINNGNYPGGRTPRSAAVAAKLAGVKYVLMVVNNQAVGYEHLGRWFDFLFDRLVVYSVDNFVTGSQAASQRLKKVLKLKDTRTRSIPNGISLRSVHETPSQVRQRLGLDAHFNGVIIGVVALMEVRKGHRVLIEAIGRLAEQIPGLKEKIVVWLEGNGPLRGELELMVCDKGLSDIVKFIGHESNVVDMMNALDMLVLPSINNEDFPNVILEAMALGKAVIASSLAGTPEQVVHGETGVLVEPGKVDALAAAILQLISDPDLTRRMGKNGKKRFEECFTADISVAKYLQLYDSARSHLKKNT